MFELEDFDLDDEVFLNTQIPIVNGESPIKLSSSNHNTLDVEDNNDVTHNVSNSINELESFYSQNIKLKNNPLKEQKISYNHNLMTQNLRVPENKSKITKPFNECETNKNLLHFDDGFDSDDEVFFKTPDISYELNNTINNNSLTKLNLSKHNNENALNVTPKGKSCTIKSSNNLNLNTTVTNVKTIIPKCVNRKFPGPAGLLSENENLYSEHISNLESLDMSISINENDKNEETFCTQANDSSFSSSPYQQFLSDFYTTDIDVLLDKYNVSWIKQKLLPYTASGQFFMDKIPFFVSVIKEIDCLSPDPTVLLADKTGNIRGTIHRAVWNQFGSQLKLGSVLVLSKVGVSCQKIIKGFTLNITSDHLLAIYSYSCENVNEVVVTRTTDLTNEEIVNGVKQLNKYNIEVLSQNPFSEIRGRITALDNLKLQNVILNQSSQLTNNQTTTTNETPTRSSVKNVFKPKTPVAPNLLKNNLHNMSEEPPTKRIRNEECKLKIEKSNPNNELSIIQNIFEGINEEELFNDFCC